MKKIKINGLVYWEDAIFLADDLKTQFKIQILNKKI